MKGYGGKDKLSKFLTELRVRAASKPYRKRKSKHVETIRGRFWLTNSVVAFTMELYFPIVNDKDSLGMNLPVIQSNGSIFQKLNIIL